MNTTLIFVLILILCQSIHNETVEYDDSQTQHDEIEVKKQIATIFDKFDINNDQQLQFDEMKPFIGAHLKTHDDLYKEIKIYDKNGDQLINREEFVDLMMDQDEDDIIDSMRSNEDPEVQRLIQQFDKVDQEDDL